MQRMIICASCIVVVKNDKSDIYPSCTHVYQFGLQTGIEMGARWSINYLIPPLAVTAAKKMNSMMGLVCTRPSYPVSVLDKNCMSIWLSVAIE